MKLTQFYLPLIGLAFISIASPSSAAGWDYKIHSGAQCQPAFGSQAADFFGAVSRVNTNTASRTLVCPIVRDSGTPAAIDAAVTVSSYNGQSLSCLFYSYDANGNYVASVSRTTTANAPTRLYFALGATQTRQDGSYFIDCSLPQYGRVINYISGEYFTNDAYRTDYGN